jgi:hypothetical protein
MTTLNVIETEREDPATLTEMAVLNFSGEEELRGVSDKELARISKERADEIYNLSYLALAQMRMGKDELVAAIRKSKEPELFMSLAESLAAGQDMARCLLQFFTSAEARLMVALATVANEDPDPDGGEDIPEPEQAVA